MNNYCTKCGNKLNSNDLKCNKCGTPVVDIKEKNITDGQKRLKKVTRVAVIVVLVIVFYLSVYPYFLMIFVKSNVKKAYSPYEVKVTYQGLCKKCTGSCDGSCITHRTIFNCFEYDMEIGSGNDITHGTARMNNWYVEKVLENGR